MLGTSCIFVVAVELTLATFCNFFMILHHFYCGAQHLFPMPCLLRTYKHTTANTKKTATLETMMFETFDPRPASKSFSTIYFMWQSMKLTSVACIGSQHTTGSRYGTDQGSIVETRHTTELKVVAPGVLEKIQLCEVRHNNVFK